MNPAMFVRVEIVGYYFLIISRQRDVKFGQLNISDQDIVFKCENILLIGNNFSRVHSYIFIFCGHKSSLIFLINLPNLSA